MRAHKKIRTLESEVVSAHRRIAKLERELEATSLRDPLTALPARQIFARHLDVEVDRAKRHNRTLAVAVLDIDGFSTINATHGRAVGDEVLKATAQLLARHTRSSDQVTRASGDEFVVSLPETSVTEAFQAFERLLLELEIHHVGPIDGISASVGIVGYTRGMTSDQLAAAAGARMRAARSAGGGRIVLKPESTVLGNGHEDAIAGLAEALTERDRYTGEHSESVVELVEQVARALGLDEREVARVRAAALLHDIGKVAIPDDLLNKNGPLTEEEWLIMREHPVIGERILRAIPGLGAVARIVRHEHERYDGGGYPDGLAGDQVPIGSRIILACDAYHAMTSDRPYRTAMSHAEAIRELAANAGTQFDPQVTEALIGCLYGRRQLAPSPNG